MRQHTTLITLAATALIPLSACQLMGPLDRELSTPEEELESSNIATPALCSLSPRQGAPWWVGVWVVDEESLKLELLKRVQGERPSDAPPPPELSERHQALTSLYAGSVSEAFELTLTAQQASLRRASRPERFPIAPLPQEAGVKLTSIESARSSTLWCQGERVYWSAERGSPLPVKRAPSAPTTSPLTTSPQEQSPYESAPPQQR